MTTDIGGRARHAREVCLVGVRDDVDVLGAAHDAPGVEREAANEDKADVRLDERRSSSGSLIGLGVSACLRTRWMVRAAHARNSAKISSNIESEGRHSTRARDARIASSVTSPFA